MKALRYILSALVAAAVLGLMGYQAFVTKDLTGSNLTKGILILAGLVYSLIRPRKNRVVGNRKALYQKAYAEFIQKPFAEEPKLEKLFYSAVDDYNRERPGKAIEKLTKLRGECQRSSDLFSVTVFTGLCLDDMQLYEEAIHAYHSALRIRPSSTLASNMGLCYQQLGDFSKAENAYEQAIELNPDNEYAYNNLSAMYFREGDYETALDYAEHALDINQKMPQALSTAAICFALLGYEQEYQDYYRRAVAAGYDGQKIKNAIKNLDPTL